MKEKCQNENWILYILQCADKTLYTGITNNIDKRLLAHQTGKGAKYTRGRGPFDLIHTETFPTKSDAARREAVVKKLNRIKKLELLS